ncbi:MAG TPA: hypothetical protein DEQ34_08975 [Balneolaceae bacterium]|nr:hypothetical protein [Balneolaceae bacterium]|tara:strand:- start:196606 stop:198273 length:1668 start_codon:yes stop_codon:yes gene_type:complete
MRSLLYLYILAVVPLFGRSAAAQTVYRDSLKQVIVYSGTDTLKVNAYLDLANDYQQTQPDTATYFALKAVELAEHTDHPYYLSKALMFLGSAYIRDSSYEKALNTLTRAREVVSPTSYHFLKANILRRLGNIYFIQFKYDEALAYFDDVMDILDKHENIVLRAKLYDNMANVYYETQREDSALLYYQKSLDIMKIHGSEMSQASIYLNMGMLYAHLNDEVKAIEYSEKALEIARRHNARVMMTYPLKVLSTVHLNRGEFDEAVEYARQSLNIASEMDIVYEMKDAHQNISAAFEQLNQLDSAMYHYKEYKTLQDSMLNMDANERLAEMRAKYETEKKEQEITLLETENKAQKARSLAIVSSLGFLLILAGSGFMWFRAKKEKEFELLEKDKLIAESRKHLAEEELANSKLREENLQKELTNYALHIVEKNDFLEQVKSEMADLRMDVQSKDAIKHINKLGSRIYQNLMINKDREEFEIQVEQACEGFFKNLEHKHPDLTNQERRLAALLRLNLSSKEISGILNISPKSVDQSRYRLRKKLDLDKDINLSTFLNQI